MNFTKTPSPKLNHHNYTKENHAQSTLNPRPSILNYRLKGSKNPKNSEDSGSTFYSKIQGTAEPL